MPLTITFPVENINPSDTVQLIFVFSSESGSVTAASQNIHVARYGDLSYEYDIDNPLMIPGKYSLEIIDGNDYLFSRFFPSSGDPAPTVEVKINGATDFLGKTVEDSITYDYATKVFRFHAMPDTSILNKKMVYDLDGNIVNPFSYTQGGAPGYVYYFFTRMIEDIFKLVDASISYSGGSLFINQAWTYRGWSWDDPYKGGTNQAGLTFSQLQGITDPLYFDNTSGLKNVGDVLKALAVTFGCFTGMTSSKKAFFKQLFYYDSGNTQTLGTVFERRKQYVYNLIDWVRVNIATRAAASSYDYGTVTNLEDKYLDLNILPFFDDYIFFEPAPPTYYSYTQYLAGPEQYNIFDALFAPVSATYIDVGDLIAKYWHYYRSSLINIRTDVFLVEGINYDFLKDFTHEGEKFQPIKMTRRLGSNLTEIEAINLGV